jgi:hypothetical protein
MQVPGSKAGGEASQALRGLILHGHSPNPLRPPHQSRGHERGQTQERNKVAPVVSGVSSGTPSLRHNSAGEGDIAEVVVWLASSLIACFRSDEEE